MNSKDQVVFNQKTGIHEKNGIPFDGHFIEWKLLYEPRTYLKESEYSGDEWRKGGHVKIYANDECVLNEFCREPERALMLLSKGLHELQVFFETVIQLPIAEKKNWESEIVGRKVHHGGIPSTVQRYCGDGEIILKRDDGKDYAPDLYPSLLKDEYYENEWHDKDKVHMTDKRINWNV